MSRADKLNGALRRLQAGEPIRLMIGERSYDASEITLASPAEAGLRAQLIADIEAQLGGGPEPPRPAAPAAAMPVEAAGGQG